MLLAAIALLALTRAEIVQRMLAPVSTQADGLIKVYADCPEDMRREYQGPVSSFASDTATLLYRGLALKPVRFAKPGIIIHIGSVRTNLADVVTRVSTNDARIVSRIYLPSPGYSDLTRFKAELTRAFYRSVKATELSESEALKALRAADPRYRISDQRARIEAWLAGEPCEEGGEHGLEDDEKALALIRKVLEPGVASRRDVLTFASRLNLYPRTFDEKFFGGADVVSFRDAIKLAKKDPRVRFLAFFKANELPIWAGGRGDELMAAAELYCVFLKELAKGEKSQQDLGVLLDEADSRLRVAFDLSKKQ